MGLFIYTEIRPKHINQEEWNEVFNETKTLLNAYKFARINFDIYDGVKRHFLDGNCIEKAEDDYEKWKVSGDLESMRTAESFSLSNRLNDKMIAFFLIEGGEYVSGVQKAILYNREFCEYILNKL